MPKKRYSNIWNNNEVNITADEYDQTLLTKKDFEKDILDDNTYVDGYDGVVVNNTVVYTVRYRGSAKPLCILWGPLKNSGSKSINKRLQVSCNTPQLAKETPYVAIGGYNTGDTHIYAVMLNGVREFIVHAQGGDTYSSLWFDYRSLWDVYKRGVYTWTDNKERDVVGCTLQNVEQIHKAILGALGCVGGQKASPEPRPKGGAEYVDFTNEIRKYKDTDTLPRNPEYRKAALERENYTCELCGTRNTFADRNNEEHFEGHHLIMYNPTVQRRFRLCLDHPDNIICLCPTCHSKIHNSQEEETKQMLIKLFSKHNGLLKTYAIKGLKDIINDYIKL